MPHCKRCGKNFDSREDVECSKVEEKNWSVCYAEPGTLDLQDMPLFSKDKIPTEEEIINNAVKAVPIEDDIPKMGIYFLCTEDRINYVGQSKSRISGRITKHLGEGEKQFDRVNFMEFHPGTINQAEGYCIMKFDPPYNSAILRNRYLMSVSELMEECAEYFSGYDADYARDVIPKYYLSRIATALGIERVNGYINRAQAYSMIYENDEEDVKKFFRRVKVRSVEYDDIRNYADTFDIEVNLGANPEKMNWFGDFQQAEDPWMNSYVYESKYPFLESP